MGMPFLLIKSKIFYKIECVVTCEVIYMANQNFQKKKIQDTENSGFGSYQEGVGGGGSPKAKDPNQRAPGVNSDYRKQNNDTMQPRTGDGKFTYKSVNGQSIDPKYGPSRGKTVNPLLTGGENGIKIEDVETDFANQSGAYWNKYKDKWYTKGGEMVTSGDFKTRVAAETIWNVAKRRYDTVKGEFEGESSVFNETKKGRPAADEKAAKQKAQATGEEQAVINQNTGAIKTKPGTPPMVAPTPKPMPTPIRRTPQPGATSGPTPIAPGTGLPNAGTGQILQAPGQASGQASGGSGLSQSNMNVLNQLFGGNVPPSVTGGATPAPTVKPSLAGFLKKKSSK